MSNEMNGAVGEAPPAQGNPEHPAALRMLEDVPFTHGFARALPSRPGLSPVGVLAALAGALLSAAAVILLGISDDPSPWLITGSGALLLAVGWGLAFATTTFARTAARPVIEDLVPFATVMTIIGTITMTAGLLLQVIRDGDPSDATNWWPALLIALVMMTLWLVPGLQGRPVILGAGLIAGTWALASLVAVQVGSDRSPTGGGLFDSGLTSSAVIPTYDSDALRAAALVSLGAGVTFLIAGALLDRLRLPGAARPAVVAGVVTAVVGAEWVAPDQAVLRALLPMLVIALVMAVGIAGDRKATTWIGALVAFPLLIQLSVALIGDRPSAAMVATVVACFGVIILLVTLGLVTAMSRPGHDAVPVAPAPLP